MLTVVVWNADNDDIFDDNRVYHIHRPPVGPAHWIVSTTTGRIITVVCQACI